MFPHGSYRNSCDGIVQRHRGRYRHLSSWLHPSFLSYRVTSRGGSTRRNRSSRIPVTASQNREERDSNADLAEYVDNLEATTRIVELAPSMGNIPFSTPILSSIPQRFQLKRRGWTLLGTIPGGTTSLDIWRSIRVLGCPFTTRSNCITRVRSRISSPAHGSQRSFPVHPESSSVIV